MSKSIYEQLAQAISAKAGNLSEHERKALKGLLDGFSSQAQYPYPSYMVPVNYDQAVENLVKNGKYDDVHRDITSKHFPSNEKGQVEVPIYLVNFNHEISSEGALRELDRQDLRPATLKELLALGSQNLNLQGKNWIAALGSTWRLLEGDIGVPYLYIPEAHRKLYLFTFDWSEHNWVMGWRFAAVCK